MKWQAPKDPVKGDFRAIKKFAWRPLRIGDEVVWLERYYIIEECFEGVGWCSSTYPYRPGYYWARAKWMTKDEYRKSKIGSALWKALKKD